MGTVQTFSRILRFLFLPQITDDNYQHFLDSWHVGNKPDVLLFDKDFNVPIVYKVRLVFRFTPQKHYRYVNTENRVCTMQAFFFFCRSRSSNNTLFMLIVNIWNLLLCQFWKWISMQVLSSLCSPVNSIRLQRLCSFWLRRPGRHTQHPAPAPVQHKLILPHHAAL